MIEKKFNGNVKEFWIVFTQGTQFISKFLPKNWSHCYVITRDKFNWIVINPMRLYMQVEIPAVSIDQDLPRLIRKPLDTVIKVTMYQRCPAKRFALFGLMSCVTAVRYLIGLRMYALTPLQLYRKLLQISDQDKVKLGIQSVKHIV